MRVIKYLAACAALAALSTLSVVHPAAAQSSSGQSASKSQKQLDVAAARADRKAIVGANMKLTDSEGHGFLAAVRRVRSQDGQAR